MFPRIRAWLVALVCIPLAGCFEVTSQFEVAADGTATNRMELALDKEVVAEMDRDARAEKARLAKSKKTRGTDNTQSQTFAEMCADMRNPPESAPGEPAWPKVPTTTKVTRRGGKVVCTIVETIADPPEYYRQMTADVRGGPDLLRLDPLTDAAGERVGYRYVSIVKMDELLRNLVPADKTDPTTAQAMGFLLTMVQPVAALLRDAKVTFAVKAARIGETNGVVSRDGKTVTWSIPLKEVFDLSPSVRPIETRADVYYR